MQTNTLEKRRFYAVCTARFKGIVRTWNEAKLLLMGNPNKNKKFKTFEEARVWLMGLDDRPIAEDGGGNEGGGGGGGGGGNGGGNEEEEEEEDAEASPLEGVIVVKTADASVGGGAEEEELSVTIGSDEEKKEEEEEDHHVGAKRSRSGNEVAAAVAVAASPVSSQMKRSKNHRRAHLGQGGYFVDKLRWSQGADHSAAELAPLCDEQRKALEIVLSGRSLLLVGEAGTGKSHLIRHMVRAMEAQGKCFSLTASTGVAASLIGACTLHAFAGIGIVDEKMLKEDFEKYALLLYNKLAFSENKAHENARERWKTCQILVIDEISMVSAGFFRLLDFIAKEIRCDNRPFGGIQLACFGDFLQLPPVKAEPLFNSAAFEACIEVKWVLKQQHRQGSDLRFGELLQHVRVGSVSLSDAELLKTRCLDLDFRNEPLFPTHVFPDNDRANTMNDKKLAELGTETHVFSSVYWVEKDFDEELYKAHLRSVCQAPEKLVLKVGAQVVLLRNLSTPSLVNGSRGVVVRFGSIRPSSYDSDEMEVCEHPSPSEAKWPIVEFENKMRILISREVWNHEEMISSKPVLVATVAQVPLRLAWALTIHKSQGMSLEKLVVDLNNANFPGQCYVALSRLKSLGGLYLKGLDIGKIKVDHNAKRYMDQIRNILPDKVQEIERGEEQVAILPPCRYGRDCYRKNPAHFREFSHPN